MSGPIRVQLSRTKGWKMPPNTVKVDRTTKWGNPFKGEVGASTGARETLVDEFHTWLTMPTSERDGMLIGPNGCAAFLHVPYSDRTRITSALSELRGKNLACWCPLGQPCHADVLLELANEDAP